MAKSLALSALFAMGLAMQAAPSHALTLTFGGPDVDPYIESGFSVDVARIVNGNCNVAPCLALNTNETSVLTRVGGGVFDLTSFWFQILGQPATLTVQAYNGATLVDQVDLLESVYPHNNGGQVFSYLFSNVTSISFHDSGRGNIRIDDANVNVSAVPIPAALPLLATGLAALGFAGRRRKAKKIA